MSHADPRCKCTMAISLTGDGCRYCQPQEYIDRLEEWLEEEERKNDGLKQVGIVSEMVGNKIGEGPVRPILNCNAAYALKPKAKLYAYLEEAEE